jgi:hypothetical protein
VSGQTELRNEMTAAVLRALESGAVTTYEAAVACMGTTAIVLAAFNPATREAVALELEGKLLEHANKRASEMRSGALDRELAGH